MHREKRLNGALLADLLRKIQPYFEERTTSSSTARERIDVQSALIHLDAYPTAGRVIALGLPI